MPRSPDTQPLNKTSFWMMVTMMFFFVVVAAADDDDDDDGGGGGCDRDYGDGGDDGHWLVVVKMVV